MIDLAAIRKKFELLRNTLDERVRRLWAGAEADALGHGGVAAVAAATGMAISTVRKGRDEVRAGVASIGAGRVRRPGAGRRRLEEKDPGLNAALEALVDPASRGDPESPLRWTCKSTRRLARELTLAGHPVSPQKVGEMLSASGYSLQGTSRVKEGAQHPDRDAQFEHINRCSKAFLDLGIPVVSVDSKKKELIGNHANPGREWQPKGKAVEVLTYDFPDPNVRKAIPYGVYDVGDNSACVNVGIDHDTPTFAVASLEKWWVRMGALRYPNATELFVTADGGGSNSSHSRVWKTELQRFADRRNLVVHVSHFPPGTSKWNKIEHRLFSSITLNWRGRPLTTYETIVSLIASTTTASGLRVEAQFDGGAYACGREASDAEMRALALARHEFHGDWNYALHPRSPERRAEAALAEKDVRARPARRTLLAWEKLVREQMASGLTSKAFCRRKGISYSAFGDHRRRVAGCAYARDEAAWTRLVREHAASGTSSAAFCRRKGVPAGAFIYWRIKLVGRVNPAAKWEPLVREQIASGLTAKAFCQQRRLNYTSFLPWRRKLAPQTTI